MKRQAKPSSNTYPSFRSGRERIALGLVLLVVVGLPLALLGYHHLQAASAPVHVVEMTARLPAEEHGGWTPEVIRVQKGERVRLRLTSSDVVHGFSIPKLGVAVDWVEPGKVQEVEFVAEQAGRYAFQCTVWCQLGHWRMRGTLEVVDPDHPVASGQDVDPPETDWVSYGIDVDAAHPGRFVPGMPPSAVEGQRIWAGISDQPLDQLASSLPLREMSPSDVYAWLSGKDATATSESSSHAGTRQSSSNTALPLSEPAEAPALAELSANQRWDVVAALAYAATTPEDLVLGAQFYERDCTGCHGLTGQGDGPGAVAIEQQNNIQTGDHGMAADRAPKDFTDLGAQAGASDLLYYGKMVRGGMGTSMPYWGTIYNEEELWAVIAHLRSFAFDYPAAP